MNKLLIFLCIVPFGIDVAAASGAPRPIISFIRRAEQFRCHLSRCSCYGATYPLGYARFNTAEIEQEIALKKKEQETVRDRAQAESIGRVLGHLEIEHAHSRSSTLEERIRLYGGGFRQGPAKQCRHFEKRVFENN